MLTYHLLGKLKFQKEQLGDSLFAQHTNKKAFMTLLHYCINQKSKKFALAEADIHHEVRLQQKVIKTLRRFKNQRKFRRE
jgi:hypothetical protein